MFKTRNTFYAESNRPIANLILVNLYFGVDKEETTFLLPEFQNTEKII